MITTIDSISYLAESLRRLFASLIVKQKDDLSSKIKELLPIFSPHLKTLKGMNRLFDDWITDNILNPASIGELFTMADAIESLPEGFEVYAASPNFITDWRWYKNIYGEEKQYNERALGQYWQNAHNLIDYRQVNPSRREEDNKKLRQLCDEIRTNVRIFENTRSDSCLCEIKEKLFTLKQEVNSFSLKTATALAEVISLLDSKGLDVSALSQCKEFGSWFGRGQQYLSITRR